MAVKKEDIAYTSPSTAENQNESVKVYVKAPTTPAARIEIILNLSFFDSSFFTSILFPNAVIVQKRNKIVNELQRADITLTATATWLVAGSANNEKILPNNWKRGAPGGCPTSSLYAVAIYSPQSQKLTVCSIVER